MSQDSTASTKPVSALEQMRTIVKELGYPSELSVSSGGVSNSGHWYFRLVYINHKENWDTYMTGHSTVSALEALEDAAQQLLELHEDE